MDALRRARSYSSNAHGEMPRSLRAPERPHSGNHRHAGCESDRKRGVSIDPVGYDAGKHALVDTEGHLLSLENIQDRDSGAGLIERALQKYPRLKKIFADGGYAGPKLASQLVGLPLELEIVKRTDKEGGFKVLRRRWVIERTFSWLRRNRRLMAHYEALVMIAVGFAKLTMIGVMLKRLTEVAP